MKKSKPYNTDTMETKIKCGSLSLPTADTISIRMLKENESLDRVFTFSCTKSAFYNGDFTDRYKDSIARKIAEAYDAAAPQIIGDIKAFKVFSNQLMHSAVHDPFYIYDNYAEIMKRMKQWAGELTEDDIATYRLYESVLFVMDNFTVDPIITDMYVVYNEMKAELYELKKARRAAVGNKTRKDKIRGHIEQLLEEMDDYKNAIKAKKRELAMYEKRLEAEIAAESNAELEEEAEEMDIVL